MKFEKIDENKIKVTVPVSYFEKNNIGLEQFTQNAPELQDFFCELMENIEKEYGFSFTNSLIRIEATLTESSFEKEIVLTLTRTKKDLNDSNISLVDKYMKRKYQNKTQEENIAQEKELDTKETAKNTPKSEKKPDDTLVYTFKNFDDLCSLAKHVSGLYKDYNSLYWYDSNYYLVLKRSNQKRAIMMIEEFGYIICNSCFGEGYLNEYGKLIFLGNALDRLCEHF